MSDDPLLLLLLRSLRLPTMVQEYASAIATRRGRELGLSPVGFLTHIWPRRTRPSDRTTRRIQRMLDASDCLICSWEKPSTAWI